jgi:hypothetical protein
MIYSHTAMQHVLKRALFSAEPPTAAEQQAGTTSGTPGDCAVHHQIGLSSLNTEHARVVS